MFEIWGLLQAEVAKHGGVCVDQRKMYGDTEGQK